MTDTRRKRRRGRILYPEVSDSHRLARLTLTGALLWDYLIAHANDQGRLKEGVVGALRMRLMPLRRDVEDADIETALAGMVRERLILRYSGDFQGPLIQITDWWKYNGRMVFKHPSPLLAPDGWRDKVTARLTTSPYPYVLRLGAGLDVTCTNCSENVIPRPHGKGYVCPSCDVELLGRSAPRPRVGGTQKRASGRLRELLLAALGQGPLTKPQLAQATGRSEGSIGSLLPVLCREKAIRKTRRKRPWLYALLRRASGRVSQ